MQNVEPVHPTSEMHQPMFRIIYILNNYIVRFCREVQAIYLDMDCAYSSHKMLA